MKKRFIRFLHSMWLGKTFDINKWAMEQSGAKLIDNPFLYKADGVASFTNQQLIDILKIETLPAISIWEKAGKELDRRLTNIDTTLPSASL